MMKKGVKYVTLVVMLGLFGVCLSQVVLAETTVPMTKPLQATDIHLNLVGETELTDQEITEVLNAQFMKDYLAFYGEFLKELANEFVAEAEKAKKEYELVKADRGASEAEKMEKRLAYEMLQQARIGAWQATLDFPLLTQEITKKNQDVLDKYGVSDTDIDTDTNVSLEQETFIFTHLKAFLLEKKERNDKSRSTKEAEDAKRLVEYEKTWQDSSKSEEERIGAASYYGYYLGIGHVPDVTPLLEEVERRLAELEMVDASTNAADGTMSTSSMSSLPSGNSSTETSQSSSVVTESSASQGKEDFLSSTSEVRAIGGGEAGVARVLPRTGEKHSALVVYGVMSLVLSVLMMVIKMSSEQRVFAAFHLRRS